MGAELQEAAVGDDPDAVGPLGGGEAVGDHDHRAALHQAVHGVLDEDLGAGVEARGGLVEHQHGRVGQRGPGQRDQLLLPRREPGAPLLHLGVEALGEAREALEHADGLQRRPTSASVASARARRTLSRIVPLNRKPSWGTTTTRSRSERSVASRRSMPPKRTVPSVGS